MTSREEELRANVNSVRERIARAAERAGRISEEITLVAVTKTYPVSDVEILHNLGIEDFAENRDNEGKEKSAVVSARWHYQGQIQSNKISSIARWASVVHSLDNARHARLLANAVADSKILSVFIQVSLDPQPGRGGIVAQDLSPLAELVLSEPRLRLEGLMAVAPLGEDPQSAFERLAQIHSVFRQEFPSAASLSAGMSGDFEDAIEHGATHVRIGSSILGSRPHLG
jgi:pyridoxal phosphate enzyme (YggS family)